MPPLDDTDLQLLRLLQNDARLTTKQLSAAVHLSTTPVYERVKRLEREGFIRKYKAVLDVDKLGQGFIVFCQVKLKKLSRSIVSDFLASVTAMPEVTECYNTSGAFDYLLKIHARDMAAYQNFVMNRLGTIECLASWESTFVMAEEKNEFGISF